MILIYERVSEHADRMKTTQRSRQNLSRRAEKPIDFTGFAELSRKGACDRVREIYPILQTRHIEETDCLQKIIESSFSNKNLFTYMLYDCIIKETRC